MVSTLASKLAKRIGTNAEDVENALAGLDEGERAKIALASALGNQPARAFGTLAEEGGQTIRKGTLAVAASPPATAALAGGAFVGNNLVKKQQIKEKRLAREDQAKVVQDVLSDPHLSSGEKNDLVDDLISSGFIDDPGAESDGGDGGGIPFFGNILQGSGPLEWVVILMLLWFGGKIALEAVDNTTGGGQ